ncbi:LysE/ArgO family amino acid transporter [Cryobacterium sp. Y57]|uniref:LysE/ArgO family amino acid transporter n=1 Tax=Cryobacterium sp. Y57 TaxID=2048287 RepID=UPI0018EE2731|nr:LysE/ArgO family amino acid transporter [Cryobacterium sp. Y57]
MNLADTILPTMFGFGTGLALIIAIGAQNAFILRLGIAGRNRTVLAAVLICSVSDAVLILAGIAGIGALIQAAPVVLVVARVLGAGFLLTYGAFAAVRAFRPGVLVAAATTTIRTKAAVATTIALTWLNPHVYLDTLIFLWLNPHVYLDTLIFLGSVANQQGTNERWWWGAGAITASFVWFFALGFGARTLRPLFAKRSSWRVLDGFIAVVMIALGVRMAVGV